MLVLIDGRASYRHLVISVLRQPRWVVLAVITLLMCVLFGFLGRWQWHRHEDRRERNQQIEAAAAAAPVPLHQVWSAADPLAEANQYRTVTLTGVYDGSEQLLLRNPNGRSGYAVVTPLVTEAGEALLVNRGWTPASSTDVSTPAADVAPPPGAVQATVRLRASEPDDDRVAPDG
ncbi:MAG: SURF1 family protein, partial [Candidatus Nanopelagicales bacterium]